MPDLEFETVDGRSLDLARVLDLYGAVGWTVYANDPGTLALALAGSTSVVVARDGQSIVGLARVVSDRATICYLQDVLVHPARQREGIGRTLVELALQPCSPTRTCARRCC